MKLKPGLDVFNAIQPGDGLWPVLQLMRPACYWHNWCS